MPRPLPEARPQLPRFVPKSMGKWAASISPKNCRAWFASDAGFLQLLPDAADRLSLLTRRIPVRPTPGASDFARPDSDKARHFAAECLTPTTLIAVSNPGCR